MSEIPTFQSTADMVGCHPMDVHLTIQVAETTLLETILESDKGLRTAIRNKWQALTTEERVNTFYRTIEPIWQAVKKPGNFSIVSKERADWDNGVKNEIVRAIFATGVCGIDAIKPTSKFYLLLLS